MFWFYIILLVLRVIYIINVYFVVVVKNWDFYRVFVWCIGKVNENMFLIFFRVVKEVVIILSDFEVVLLVKVGCLIWWEMLILFCICIEC